MNQKVLILALLAAAAGCNTAAPPPPNDNLRLVGPAQFSPPADNARHGALALDTAALMAPRPKTLHARVLFQGNEYETIAPVRLDLPAEETAPRPLPKAAEPSTGFGQVQQPVIGIIGTDQRYRVASSTSYPASTAMLIEFSNGFNCSGVLIGPHTMVTAAHCFYDPGNNTWRDTAYMAAGADIRAAGTGGYPQGYPFGATWSWIIYLPSSFHAWGSSSDIALVDFSYAGTTPGLAAGWMGTTYNRTFVNEGGDWGFRRNGYDADKQVAGGTSPQEWAAEGGLFPACFGVDGTPYPDCDMWGTSIDIASGGSGSGVYTVAGSYANYIAGVETSGEVGPLTNTNYGTSWRPWVYNFVHGNDSHWP